MWPISKGASIPWLHIANINGLFISIDKGLYIPLHPATATVELANLVPFSLTSILFLWFSALNQRNNIEVNEKGTKLASSTVAVAGCKGIYRPLSIEINRPFIFAICSHGIDAPLLIGHITGSNF